VAGGFVYYGVGFITGEACGRTQFAPTMCIGSQDIQGGFRSDGNPSEVAFGKPTSFQAVPTDCVEDWLTNGIFNTSPRSLGEK